MTAVGDAIDVAQRLRQLTRVGGVGNARFVISRNALLSAGLDADTLPWHTIAADTHCAAFDVHTAASSDDVASRVPRSIR